MIKLSHSLKLVMFTLIQMNYLLSDFLLWCTLLFLTIWWDCTGYTSAQMTITVCQQNVHCVFNKRPCNYDDLILIFAINISNVISSVSLAGMLSAVLTLIVEGDCFRGILSSYTFTAFG